MLVSILPGRRRHATIPPLLLLLPLFSILITATLADSGDKPPGPAASAYGLAPAPAEKPRLVAGGGRQFGPMPDNATWTATMVSGYWLISSKYPAEQYEAWFRRTLLVNATYVFFYDGSPEMLNYIYQFRVGLPTTFVKRNFSDFEFFNGLNYSTEVGDAFAGKLPSPLLGRIWLEKAVMLSVAADLDIYGDFPPQNPPFAHPAPASGAFPLRPALRVTLKVPRCCAAGSDFFCWNDAGNSVFRTIIAPPPTHVTWPHPPAIVDTLPKHKIMYSGTREAYHDFAATAFMYHRGIVRDVVRELRRVYQECTEVVRDWYCMEDQYLFTELRKQRPGLYYRIGWGYGSVIYVLLGPRLDFDYLRMMDPDCGRFGHTDCFGEPLPANVTEWKEPSGEVSPLTPDTFMKNWTRRGQNMYCETDLPPHWVFECPKWEAIKAARQNNVPANDDIHGHGAGDSKGATGSSGAGDDAAGKGHAATVGRAPRRDDSAKDTIIAS